MRINEIKNEIEKIENAKICVWGTGKIGKLGYGLLTALDVVVDFFGDNNEERWNQEIIDGVMCIPTDEIILEKNSTICFIMAQKRRVCDEIYNQLRANGFTHLICRYELFDSGKSAEMLWQMIQPTISDFYCTNPRKNTYHKECTPKKGVVYTCISGNYDNLRDISTLNEEYDYYYIADNEIESIKNMKFISIDSVVPDYITSSVLKARYCKTHPHTIFKNYDVSIYIDGKLSIIGDITEIESMICGSKIRFGGFKHPDRDCIFKEGIACTILGKAKKQEVTKQLNEYLRHGMPYQYGLIDTCVLVRRHNDKDCMKIMEDWWNEISTKTTRDQLSFTYVLWKNNFILDDMTLFPYNLLNNPYFKIEKHNKKELEV